MSRLFISSPGTNVVTVAPAAEINNLAARTLMFWGRPVSTGGGGFGTAWSRTSASYGEFSDDIDVYIQFIDAATDASSTSTVATFALNQWAHVAITYDNAGDRKIYQFTNGVAVASYTAQTAASGALANDSATNLLIGKYIGSNSFTWDGYLYDFRLYNSVLSAANILAIKNGGHTFDPASANNVCHLTFASDQGTPEPDASGNGNDGVITGTTFSSSSPFGRSSGGVGSSAIAISNLLRHRRFK